MVLPRIRGLSSLVAGIALALLVLAVGVFAYSYVSSQLSRIPSDVNESGLACWGFVNGSSYVVFIVNYLDKPVENVRVTYNTSSIQTISITRIEPGSIVSVTLPGRPVACISQQVVYVKMVNELR